MSIWLKIFGPEPEESRMESVYFDYDTPKDKPPYSDSRCETHIIWITYKHPILRHLKYTRCHKEINSHAPDIWGDCTELAGGTGIGKSIERNRATTAAFLTLDGIMCAYWDHHGIGPAMLKLRERELDDLERYLKRSFLYHAMSLPELMKIDRQRKKLQDRQKELEIRIRDNYPEERRRRRHRKGTLVCERESLVESKSAASSDCGLDSL